MSTSQRRETARHRRGASILLVLAVVSICAWYAVARACNAPPRPRAADAPGKEFSAARALLVLGALFDGEPHPTGTAAHARVRERIIGRLDDLGLSVEVQETIACGRDGVIALVRNVIARERERPPGRPSVLVCAHYDSVAAGPGAGDDGAGVATLLEVARALADEPRRAHPVDYLFTDAEELGLVGAEGFVAQLRTLAEVGVVVNVEARGTSGPSAMFETSAANAWLIDRLAASVEQPSAVSAAYEIYKRMPNDTDLSAFKRAGVPGYNFAFIGGLRHYHTPLDDLAHLSPASVQHHGDNVLALVRALADGPLEAPETFETAAASESSGTSETSASDRAVYADVLGFGLVGWREPWSLVLAFSACALVALGWARASRTGTANTRGILWGMGLAVALPSLAALAGWAQAALLRLVRGVPDPWCAHPELLRSACFASSIALGAVVCGSAETRRAGFEALAIGVGAAVCVLAVACATFVPSASYLFVLPALTAGTALAIGVSLRSFLFRAIRVLAPLSVAAVFWFPLLHGVELAFEFEWAAAISSPIGALLAFAAPALAEAPARTRWILAAAAAAIGLAAFLGACCVPTHSADAPAPLSLVHVETASAGSAERTASFAARTYRWELPRSLREVGFTAPKTRPAPWWPWDEELHLAPAPPTGAPAPEIEALDPEAPAHAGSRVRARVRSPRAARWIALELPSELALVSVGARGATFELAVPAAGRHVLAGFGSEAIEIELMRRSAGVFEVALLDVFSGLPSTGEALLAARPRDRVPRGEGDISVVGSLRRL